MSLLVLLLLVQFPARAVTSVRNYTIRDGLSDSTPRCLMQDRAGVLWIGTWNGLDRFDGGSFRAVSGSAGASFGTTLGLSEALDGSVWICNHDGISRIDPVSGSTRPYKIGYGKAPQTIDAFSMDISTDGHVFGSAANWGICCYQPASDEMIPFNIVGVATIDIRQVLCLGEDVLLLLRESGALDVVRYAWPEGVIDAARVETGLPEGTVAGMFKVEGGAAIVTEDSWLHILDGASLTVSRSFRIPEGVFSTGAAKEGTSLAAISFRSCKTVEIDLSTGVYEQIRPLDGKFVSCLLYGTEDILWAGVSSGGLLSVVHLDSGMTRVLNKDIFGDRICNVSSFFEMPGGEVLVATEGSGLYVYGPDGRTSPTVLRNGSLDGTKIYDLERGIGRDVLVGSEDRGLDVLLEDGRIQSLSHADPRIGNVYSICRDNDRDCWYLGLYGHGVARMRARKDAAGRYVMTELTDWASDDPDCFSGKLVMDLVATKDGYLLVGTLSEGCLVFDLQNERFLSESLIPESVLSLYAENDTSVWIGTGGSGLCHVTMGKDGTLQTDHFGLESGLKDLSVHGILQDALGRIWVSTNMGISCLDPLRRESVSFYDADYLQSNEFSNSSCLAASDGTFLFGGVEGFNRFDPLKLRKRAFEPDVLFTAFTLIQDPVRTLPCRESVVLRHDENYFSIAFSAIEFIGNSNCEYAYRLVGLNDQWISQAKASPVTYSNLSPGKYRFEVRCTNGDKRWSSRTAVLGITIRPPWWNTWWACLLYAGLLALGAWGISRLVRRRMRQKREMEMAMLQKQHENETYEAKLRFFTNVAHEFGTPLTLISGAGEQLLDGCHLESRPTRYVNIIKDNADRMQRLIKELMDFRKVETGHYTPSYSRFDIVEMVRRIFDGYSAVAEKNEVRQTLSVPDAPILLVSDYSAVEKILHNLMSNAHKYTPEGGNIEVGLSSEGDASVRISVANSGKGIRPEDLPNVFDRYVVLENLESEAKSGRIVRNGVGLALVHALVQVLGGSISVSSEQKKSTVFELILPSARDQESILATPAPSSFMEPESPEFSFKPEEKGPVHTGLKVLVVDDEKPIRDLVSEILSDRYEVIQASDGKEAVELISHGLPDLIITDIAMPRMNGLELCRYLKGNEITRNIPIVFLSFLSDIQNEIGSYETGGEAFIPKPFYPRHLTAVVDKILSGRESLKSFYGSVVSNSDILNEKVVMKSDRDFIVKLTGVIEADLSNEALSLAYLCDRMNVSKAQMYRKLNELVGMSPVEFIRVIRLEHAARLLKTTQLTVQEIMYEVGFNNKSYFYREFGKAYGQSPRSYRESAQS